MEAVAAVSSIAGIVSLVGQALNGIVTLRGFYQDCASASRSIQRFLKRLNDLIQILEDVKELMTKLEASPSKAVADTVLASLRIQIEDCSKDVYKWLEMARKSMPGSSTGTKASFKQFLVALEKHKITDVYVEIAAHKDNVMTKLSVIGRCFDIEQSATLDSLSAKLDLGLATKVEEMTQAALWANWQEIETAMNSTEPPPTLTAYNFHPRSGSGGSLASIADSLSRIESKMDNMMGSGRSRYGSNHGSTASAASASGAAPLGFGPPDFSNSMDEVVYPPYSPATSPSFEDLCAWQNRTNLPDQLDSSLNQSISINPADTATRFESCKEAVKHHPGSRCLRSHYTSILQDDGIRPFSHYPTKYLDLILLAEMIRFKINLFKTTPSILFGASEETVQSEVNFLAGQLCILNSEAKETRLSSWKNGLNTHDLDHHMSRCRKFGPDPKPVTMASQETFGEQRAGIQSAAVMDASKHDRINMWLLGNLQASTEEKKRHRALLGNSNNMTEEQWARLVLKYWLLDDAATRADDKPASTNGAVDSAGMCHSARVMIETLMSPNVDDIRNEQAVGMSLGEKVQEDKMEMDEVVKPESPASLVKCVTLRHKKRKYAESV